MAVQSEIGTLAGFDYQNNGSALAGATLYLALITGSVFPVGNAVITHSSTVGGTGATECSGTGYARQSFVMGATSNGIMTIPSVTFNNGTNAWSSNVAAVALITAASGGTTLYFWDGPAVADMSVVGSEIVIASLSYFLENPGGA